MQIPIHDRPKKPFFGVIAILVLCAFLPSTEAQGATYYLSPQGSDSSSGTSSSSSWQTFKFAIPKLLPGDTLLLANGTYKHSNSGFPLMQCGTNAKNGTVAQRITVKALNERKALIQGTGFQDVMTIHNCSYWTFEGLRVESADANTSPKTGVGYPIIILNSEHLIFRRLLLSFNNRYNNTHALKFVNSDENLIEENELYSYHRHGISISNGNNNIVRRNYLNGRGHADISGGYPSEPTSTSDLGIVFYPGNNNIAENNIIENSGAAMGIEAYGLATNNKFFGNIARNNDTGAILHARANKLEWMAKDTYFENHVALDSKYYGGYFRAAKNTRCNHCTSLGSGLGGFAADEPAIEGDGQPSVFYDNTLSVDNTSYGFLFSEQDDYGINTSNAYNQSVNFDVSGSSNYTNKMTIDPILSNCKVWIPDASPMKGAGNGGSDIGANVLYRYQDGVLTDEPLWNTDTGAYTCGALVAGVNNVPGSSCFDVHKRLNVNSNGCLFPKGYDNKKPDNEPPLTPTKVKIIN